jgi:nicotinamide riboside transporter PnuC
VTRTTTSTAAQLHRAALGALVALTPLVGLVATNLHGLKAAGLTGALPLSAALIATGIGLVLVLLAGILAFAELYRAALATALVGLSPVVGLVAANLHGLKAAGLTGTPPPNAALVKQLLDTLASNWLWLVGTGVGLVLVLLAGMLAFGSRSAPDVLFRVIAGIGLILVVIPTALA